ncbi:hypothetical protein [Streptomyces sp. NPDC049906]|uniref:hypothetical protein n=1 Tax=Streptomyces sp. NPDC049906 TaxID=3155656 RepID=UPI00343AE4D1
MSTAPRSVRPGSIPFTDEKRRTVKFLNRLGDTLLGKLVPETEASAAAQANPCTGSCPRGACLSSAPQPTGACIAGQMSIRCCYWGGSACPVRYCGPWSECAC